MASRMIDPATLLRYRQQIASGFRLLRFETEIEREYCSDTQTRLRGAAQICGMAALLIWLGFAGLDVARVRHIPAGALSRDDMMLWFGARWLVVAMIGIGMVAAHRRLLSYPWIAWISYIALGLAAAVTGHIARRHGSFAADSSVIVIVMAAWLPLGFLFWRALTAALVVAGGTILLSFLADDPRALEERVQVALMLTLAVPLAAVGGYLREYADRQQFLLASLRYRESMTDSLTGLPNRRHLYFEAGMWLDRHRRLNLPWAMAVLDLDRFKPFNDRFGHQAGDEALQRVAEALKVALQPLDGFAARLGGEEFCLLLPGAPDQAEAAAAAAQTAVLALALPHPDAASGVLSASVGLATAQGAGLTFDSLLRRADTALYAAKSTGRGSLRWSETEVPPAP